MKQRIKFIFTTWFIAISLFTINAQDVQTNKNDMENLIAVIVAVLLCILVVKAITRTAIRLIAIGLIILMTLTLLFNGTKIQNPVEAMTNSFVETTFSKF